MSAFAGPVGSPALARKSTLPYRLQPMLATLTDAPFESRNGKIISHSYVEVAKALEGVKTDAVIDGELVAIGKDGVSGSAGFALGC